ncbi:MAG: hypothetical protein K5798_11075 [Nitrosopumilus sp.]|uniref:hypothetical protein n=1 Tax=Nitrosopumilus sp. TaxID=2024843 RepID=UPI00242A69A3|nr:hypothetical protein [Nitrosopumilus sp.]MCV0367787.1 hypothetical protein [Nitrosopumilus sp.]
MISTGEISALHSRITQAQIPKRKKTNFHLLTWSIHNLNKNKYFDQIGFHQYKDSLINFIKGGTINFVGAVYRNDKNVKYKLTDHLPMWTVFSTKRDKKHKYINP